MSVQIHINGENAAEAVKELAVLASHLGGGQAAPETAAPAVPAVPAKPSRQRNAAKPDSVEEKPADVTPTDDASAAEPDPTPDTDSAPVPTVVELRAKAQQVGSTPEDKKAIKALLDKFESKSISDVPEDKRSAFLAALEDLA